MGNCEIANSKPADETPARVRKERILAPPKQGCVRKNICLVYKSINLYKSVNPVN
jgi:hypothetical protein